MTKDKTMCGGCYNDFYNHSQEYGCWSFKSAKIVTRIRVGLMEEPPYSKSRAKKYLSCYHPQRDCMINVTDPRVKGGAK